MSLSVLVTADIDADQVPQVQNADARATIQFLGSEEQKRWGQPKPLPLGPDADDAAGVRIVKALAETQVIFCGPQMPSNVVDVAPKLEWVQLRSAGLDRLLQHPVLNTAKITTGSGNHAVPIAEYVFGIMIMFVKGWPGLFRDQVAHRWQRFSPGELAGHTVGIVGMGHIGEEVARLARAFNMRVIGTKRSVNSRTVDANGHEMYPLADLHALLQESDFVVLAMPLTKETRHMIGEAELRALKPSAYLINIARGAVVDEPVLIRALREKWFAGAGLDVTEVEPLPADSPLWELDNVLISPHHTGMTKQAARRGVDLFCENLQRHLNGQPLLNLVDVERGY